MENILSVAHDYGYGWPFIVVISIVVFLHEYGHYWVARRCGIRIESFSIGFGKEIFGWTDKAGTRWRVAWLPLGGYVKMFGDADPASSPDEKVKTMTEEEKKVSFFHQSVNKRMAVAVAGPAANYISAILLLTLLFMVQGQPYSPATVGGLTENSVAGAAGLQIGDKIISIDGESVARFEDIKRIISLSDGSPLPFVIDRAGAPLTLSIAPEMTLQKDRFGGDHRLGRIGISSNAMEYKKWGPLSAVGHATLETWTLTTSTLKAIGQMMLGTRGAEEVGGPIRIAKMAGHVAQDGVWALVWFIAIISVNLGFFNLLPVPILDGGHLLFYTYEKIRGRPLGEKAQEIGLKIGLALLGSLMIFATLNDLDIPAKLRGWLS